MKTEGFAVNAMNIRYGTVIISTLEIERDIYLAVKSAKVLL